MVAPTGKPRGRPKGSKGKRTREREAALQRVSRQIGKAIPDAFAGDAHALLIAVYKDPRVPIDVRIDAAKAAIRYEKPALQSVEVAGPDGGAIPLRLESLTDAQLGQLVERIETALRSRS